MKIYDAVLENKSIVQRNYTLMQLADTALTTPSQLYVREILDKNVPKINRLVFSKLITEDKMWNNIPNYQVWLNEVFGKLNNFVRS